MGERPGSPRVALAPVPTSPEPPVAVARELAAAAGAALVAPLHTAAFLARRGRLVREFRADLATQAPPSTPPPPPAPLDRRLRLFVSCAEPSGELHAANLVRAIDAELAALGAPPAQWTGLGGPALERLGVARVGDPVARAAMGLGVVAALPFYLRLLTDAAEALRAGAPDLVLAVDSPALHVPLGHLAKRYGRRVVHFVTPQYWGWAPWRVAGYRRAVDLALSILPFEPAWFARHGVRAEHVGHPLLDELAGVPPTRPDPASRTLVLLPGSRRGVIERNLPWMLERAAEFRARHPEAEVVLPHARDELAALLREHLARSQAAHGARLADEPLHAVLARARAALSVSGTVLLDLLHHRLPTVVVYRVASAFESRAARHLLTVPWFAAPNLLAGAEVCREFCFHGEGPREAVLAALTEAWVEGAERERRIAGLEVAAERLGPPGASARAARWALAEAARAARDAAELESR